MNIGIIGTGVYAVALMHTLEKNDNKIKMWTHSREIKKEFEDTHKLKSLIECEIGKNVTVHTKLSEVMENSEIIYIVTTSNFFNSTINSMLPYFDKQIICIATKGLDDVTNDFLSSTVKNILNTENVAILSGPSFAIDMINNDIVSLTLAVQSKKTSNLIYESIASEFLVIEQLDDIIGVQLCNTFKNIVAISSGMLNALGYSNSANAYLITKSLSELKSLIEKLNGNPLTVLSASGVGDLLLTCTSVKSRNYTFGQRIIKEGIENLNLKETTVEGYQSLIILYNLLQKENISSPLINILYEIIFNKKEVTYITKYLTK